MKLSCASTAFAHAFDRGDVTQLEFLEKCAREFAFDGVVLDVRHFPRTDGDYLAQIKKMAADLGLDVAAVRDDAFFAAADVERDATLAIALATGAPLIAAPLQAETACSWSAQLERLSAATSAAKKANVTLALRNAPGTFGASAHDFKHAGKEADSAWLRFGPEPALLDAADDAIMLAKTVLLWEDAARPFARRDAYAAFRGHLVLDDESGEGRVQPRDTSAVRGV
jgi:sugar phosphate isomerase/epimerase